MNWLWFALFNVCALTIWYLFLTGTPKNLPTHYTSKITYACIVLIYGGLFAFIYLLILYYKFPVKIHTLYENYYHLFGWEYIVPGILAPSIAIANVFALAQGGGIAISVVNLNLITTLIATAWLYNYKINTQIITGAIIGMLGISYATYESIKIN